jgi:hypothetical protein
MTKSELIDWALETDATFPDIQDALGYWGLDDSYEATCKFINELEESSEELQQ